MSAVSGSLAIAGSTQKLSGNSYDSPAARVCWLKQKQAVLWKYFPTVSGVTLYSATPVTGVLARLWGVQRQSRPSPNGRRISSCTGAKSQGRLGFVLALKRTVTSWRVAPGATDA